MSKWTTTATKHLKLRHPPVGSLPINPTSTPFSSSTYSPSSASDQIANTILVAHITKTLSHSGPRNLDPDTIPLSESLVLEVLRRGSLHPLKKTDFFRWCSLGHSYKHSACTYSQMFRSLCSAGYLEEVVGLLRYMKEDGVAVGSDTFKLLLNEFIRAERFDLAIEVIDFMEEVGTELDPRMYDSVIVALARKGQVNLALSILCKLLEASNGGVGVSIPGSVACNAVMVALRKADMRREFIRVFDKLRETKGFELDTWGYNICIHAFGCWGEENTSLRLFKELKEKSSSSELLAPDLCTYNSLIHVLCLVGRVSDAVTVYDELKVSGHDPDAFTYRILIQGCCKIYRINDATRIFSEMEYNGYIPDTIVYNSLLDGMLKARKVIDACQLFEKMVQDGVRASTWTYNILIDGLCRNGRAEAGYSLFCDLKKKGQFVDAVTFNIIVSQLCREGLLDEALRLVEEMQERGFVIDLVVITSLLIGFHKQGLWDSMERLMKYIRDGNLITNVIKWKANLEASLKSPQSRSKDFTPLFPQKGNLMEMLNFMSSSECTGTHDGNFKDEESSSVDANKKCNSTDIDEWSPSPYMDHLANQAKSTDPSSQLFMLARGKRVQGKGADSFDIDMVNTFLSIFLSKGKLSLACKLFEIFTEMGVNPVTYSYNQIVSSFVKKGYFNEAWDVFGEMGEKVCPADIATYNLIIQGLGKMGRADLASSVLDKLMKQGGYLDVVMYNTLINSLGKAGRVDEANELFVQMKKSGINPDVVTFNTLIEVHSKAGRLKDAYKFLRMMLDAGCLPNHVTDTTLDFLAKEIERQRFEKASLVRPPKDESSNK